MLSTGYIPIRCGGGPPVVTYRVNACRETRKPALTGKSLLTDQLENRNNPTINAARQSNHRRSATARASGEVIITRVNAALHGGLVVTEVLSDGVAGRANIQRGDILIGLHQWETLTADNVNYVLTHPELATFNPVRFFIIRSGQLRRGWLPQID